MRTLSWAMLATVVLGLLSCAKTLPPERGASHATESTTSDTRQGRYQRKHWHHWIDADHDCQNTRTEVLIAESEVPVEFKDAHHCEVKRGQWTCPYTGRTVTEPSALDIDHVVPLANAHRSGGFLWSPKKKEAYANNLDHAEHLVAVIAAANRAKADKDPAAWMPPNAKHACQYVRDWQAIKKRWNLTMTALERHKIAEILSGCR